MGILDAPMRSVAANLMAKFGTSITVRSVTHATYSVTDGASAESTSDTAVKGTLEEYQAHEVGDAVKVGDRKLTIAAKDLTFTPDTEDRVLIGTTIYRVVSVESVYSGDEAALYVIQLRGSA